jgi:hypothetical protein
VFVPWEVNVINPRYDGSPSPVTYTLDSQRPHLVSVIDIDARDMKLEISIDGVAQGETEDFELNTSVYCGEDLASCLDQNFSTGSAVVPAGKHTVEIAWAGKGARPIVVGDFLQYMLMVSIAAS